MNRPMPSSWSPPSGSPGFSLVEVTVAIGIFAFVAVGILGLLPAALKIRSDSAQETRGVMIAQELFSSVRTSPSITNVRVRTGPRNAESDMRYNQNLTNTFIVVGYPAGTTVPYWFFEAPGAAWTNASAAHAELLKAVKENNIQTVARLSARRITNDLYQLTVEVRSPATLALSNARPVQFTSLYYSP